MARYRISTGLDRHFAFAWSAGLEQSPCAARCTGRVRDGKFEHVSKADSDLYAEPHAISSRLFYRYYKCYYFECC